MLIKIADLVLAPLLVQLLLLLLLMLLLLENASTFEVFREWLGRLSALKCAAVTERYL